MHHQTFNTVDTEWSQLVNDEERALAALNYHDHMFISTEENRYIVGDVIRGKMVIHTSERLSNTASVYVEFQNKITTYWSDSSSNDSGVLHVVDIPYSQRITFSENVDIMPGYSVHHFEFSLPHRESRALSTFSRSVGNIDFRSYWRIKSHIKRSGTHTDLQHRFYIPVFVPSNLGNLQLGVVSHVTSLPQQKWDHLPVITTMRLTATRGKPEGDQKSVYFMLCLSGVYRFEMNNLSQSSNVCVAYRNK